jgi:ferric-dicitrate binding protein FerR (iron transport regulator)
MRNKTDTTGFDLTPAECELERILGQIALPTPQVDLYQAAFDAGQTTMRRSRRRWRIAAVGVLMVALVSGYAVHGSRFGENLLARHTPAAVEIVRQDGPALVKHEGASTWEEIQEDCPKLFVGDTLLCMHGSLLTLGLPDKSTIVLAGNSRLTLAHENGGMELALAYGCVTADLTSPHPPFVIDTPQGRIHALGTTFTVTVNGKESS